MNGKSLERSLTEELVAKQRQLDTIAALLREIYEWTKLKHTPWAQNVSAALTEYEHDQNCLADQADNQ